MVLFHISYVALILPIRFCLCAFASMGHLQCTRIIESSLEGHLWLSYNFYSSEKIRERYQTYPLHSGCILMSSAYT